jgi:iron complex transport system substrate-binding protein
VPSHRPLVAAILACIAISACGAREDMPPAAAGEVAARIVTLSPHLTELVYSAGAGHKLVGVVEYSDYPPAALEKPRIGDAFRLDYEVLTELDPDLVIAWQSGTPVDVQDRLRGLGFRVVAVEIAELDAIPTQLVRIGELAGTPDPARSAADKFAQRLAELRRRYADAVLVDVFYQISAQPLFTITARHVIDDAIGICGGRNVFADVPGVSPAVSLEAVIAAKPEVIVAGDDRADDTELRMQWAEWSSIPAVRDGRIYVVNADLMHRTTLRTLEAVEQLCAQLEVARG